MTISSIQPHKTTKISRQINHQHTTLSQHKNLIDKNDQKTALIMKISYHLNRKFNKSMQTNKKKKIDSITKNRFLTNFKT